MKTVAVRCVLGLALLCAAAPSLYAKDNKGKVRIDSSSDIAPTWGVGVSKIGVSGPLSLIDGNLFWGPYVSYLYEIYPSVEVGGETGFQIYSGSGASQWNIPLVATGLYHFHVSGLHGLSPFVGASLGIGIRHTSVDAITIGGLTVAGASKTSAVFQGYLHGGAEFGDTRNWFFDLRMGLLSSSFMFVPSVGYFF